MRIVPCKMQQNRHMAGASILLGVLFLAISSAGDLKSKLNAFDGPVMKILYCYSWGYNKVFGQYYNILREKYPDLLVLGDNYPPPAWRMIFAQCLGLVKLLLIISVALGFNVWTYFRMAPPSWFNWLLENKIYGCMMVFFVINAVESQLISTGAFEISFNEVPVWSKLDTGRVPQPHEVFQIIENHLAFQDGWRDRLWGVVIGVFSSSFASYDGPDWNLKGGLILIILSKFDL